MRPRIHIALVALLTAAGLTPVGRAAAPALPRVTGVVPTTFVTWRDRGLELRATPIVAQTIRDRAGRLHREVRVVGPNHRFRAWVGAEAVVRFSTSRVSPATWDRLGLIPVKPLMPTAGIWLVRDVVPNSSLGGIDLAARLVQHIGTDGLLEAVPDLATLRRVASMAVPPDDPRYGGQWYLKRLKIEAAWAHSTGSPETSIVVIDNGCDMAHPDLEAHILPGLDVVDGDEDPTFLPGSQGNNHGTACAGVVAAVGDNAEGIAGVCPECHVRCVRLLDEPETPVELSSDIAAFNFVLESGAPVTSNSWGYVEPAPVSGPLAAAVEHLFDTARDGKGALVVFAAGNEDRTLADDELTGVRGVITVGATNNFDEAAPFSNIGTSLDLTAPAGTVTTDISGPEGDDPSDYTALFGGTSSACPVVAGVAALLFDVFPDATAAQVHDALRESARKAPYATPDPTGHDLTYGKGIVDPNAALERLAMALGRELPGSPVPVEADPVVEAVEESEPTDLTSGMPDTGSDDLSKDEAPTAAPAGCVAGGAPGIGGFAVLFMLISLAVTRRSPR